MNKYNKINMLVFSLFFSLFIKVSLAYEIPTEIVTKASELIEKTNNSRHKQLLTHFINKKIEFSIQNPIITDFEDQYPDRDIPLNELDYFQVLTSLIVPTPIKFLRNEIKDYEKFFSDHIKSFIPFRMFSNRYDSQTNIMSVHVEVPEALKIRHVLEELYLNYTIVAANDTYSFILNMEFPINVNIRDSLIKISLEDIPNSDFCIAHFSALTHYNGDDAGKIKTAKTETLVSPDRDKKIEGFANKLRKTMQPLILDIQKALFQKYEAIESNNLVTLASLLKKDVLDYGKFVIDEDKVVFAKRAELARRLLDLRTQVVESNTESIKAFNDVVYTASRQKAYGREYINEYFPLIKDPLLASKSLLTDIFILTGYADEEESSFFSKVAQALFNFHEYTSPLTQSYALKIKFKFQVELLQELLLLGFEEDHSLFQQVGLINNSYAASVFHHLLQKGSQYISKSFNKHFNVYSQPYVWYIYFPDSEFFELATQVKTLVQKKAFKTLLYSYNPSVESTYKGEVAHEILSIENDYALNVFNELLIQGVEESVYYVYAARVRTQAQEKHFLTCYFEYRDRDPKLFKSIVE
ncbi:MAG: hypothetical protein HYS98_00920 [Deltaproteobacteria bacterium]|nr:hypothetical protein [Deltaproteobacteria bacterium]